MKKVFGVLIAICMIVLLVLVFKLSSDITKQTDSQNQKISQIESNVDNLSTQIEEMKNEVANTVKNSSAENSNSNSSIEVEFDSDKMKVSADDVKYEEANTSTSIEKNLGIKVVIKDGKAYISTDTENENLKNLYDGEDVNEIENEEIKGFSTDVKNVFCGVFGQDLSDIILFLMDDGTVEYIKAGEMLRDEKYESLGKIDKAKNIVDFVYVSVEKDDDSGYMSTIAIDENGYGYDLYELIDI